MDTPTQGESGIKPPQLRHFVEYGILEPNDQLQYVLTEEKRWLPATVGRFRRAVQEVDGGGKQMAPIKWGLFVDIRDLGDDFRQVLANVTTTRNYDKVKKKLSECEYIFVALSTFVHIGQILNGHAVSARAKPYADTGLHVSSSAWHRQLNVKGNRSMDEFRADFEQVVRWYDVASRQSATHRPSEDSVGLAKFEKCVYVPGKAQSIAFARAKAFFLAKLETADPDESAEKLDNPVVEWKKLSREERERCASVIIQSSYHPFIPSSLHPMHALKHTTLRCDAWVAAGTKSVKQLSAPDLKSKERRSLGTRGRKTRSITSHVLCSSRLHL